MATLLLYRKLQNSGAGAAPAELAQVMAAQQGPQSHTTFPWSRRKESQGRQRDRGGQGGHQHPAPTGRRGALCSGSGRGSPGHKPPWRGWISHREAGKEGGCPWWSQNRPAVAADLSPPGREGGQHRTPLGSPRQASWEGALRACFGGDSEWTSQGRK